jgi:hypothetical protein
MNYLLPLSIIALGILLLLGNLNVLSIREIWLLLKTWWPAIIILWGLHMLAADLDRGKNRKHSDNDASGT